MNTFSHRPLHKFNKCCDHFEDTSELKLNPEKKPQKVLKRQKDTIVRILIRDVLVAMYVKDRTQKIAYSLFFSFVVAVVVVVVEAVNFFFLFTKSEGQTEREGGRGRERDRK